MKRFFSSSALLFSMFCFSQNFIQAYQNRVELISQDNINNYLQEFEDLGVKKTGTQTNENALQWLKNKYLALGYTDSQIVEDPWNNHGYSSANLVVTKTGTLYPNTYVIICGHFDSIVGPGTNDNGSGTSIILEIARILKNVPTEYSIRFINFSGEEQGLYGSDHYVKNRVNSTEPKMDIKLVFNIDEVGGVAGEINDTIYCDRDESYPTTNNTASAQITQELANCVALYSTLKTDFDPAYASDYVPFQQNGEIITGFYEHNISPYPHSTQDILENMDPVYVFNVAKAALGAAQHFAVADTEDLSTNNFSEEHSIEIYPNPSHDFINIKIENPLQKDFKVKIFDLSGKLLSQSENATKIDISHLKPGIYWATLLIGNQKTSTKIVIE